MTSVYSINAENSRCLIDGIYSCFIRQKDIVITDGRNEWSIAQADLLDLEQRLTAIIDGKSDVGHEHVISDVNGLQDELDSKAALSHNHDSTYAGINHTHLISDVTDLETSLNGKADVNHNHEIGNIYKTITVVDSNTGTTSTTNKPLETLINERETDIRALINGKANSSHTHNATEVIYKAASGNDAAVNVKQQLDVIMSQLEVFDSAGTRHDIFDILFGADAVVSGVIDGGLISAVSTLQGEVGALQAQVSAIAGTNAVGNTVDGIMDAADEMSDFSDVATEGRGMLDSLDDFMGGLRNRFAHQTNSYTQLTNDYTSPSLSSVSNADMLADISHLHVL